MPMANDITDYCCNDFLRPLFWWPCPAWTMLISNQKPIPRVVMRKLCMGLVLLIGSVAGAESISLRADVWFPMNGEAGSSRPGYMIEVADKVFGAAGYQLDYSNQPWVRAVRDVREGLADCVVGAYWIDTPDFVFGEEPLGMDIQAFFVRRDHPFRYRGQAQDLRGLRLGVIGGYAYGEEYDRLIRLSGAISEPMNDDNALEQNIRKMLAGRIDTTLESKFVMQAKLKDLGLQQQVIMAGQFGEPTPMYIACSPIKPTSKHYVTLLDNGIRAMRASGELQVILQRYGLADWQ